MSEKEGGSALSRSLDAIWPGQENTRFVGTREAGPAPDRPLDPESHTHNLRRTKETREEDGNEIRKQRQDGGAQFNQDAERIGMVPALKNKFRRNGNDAMRASKAAATARTLDDTQMSMEHAAHHRHECLDAVERYFELGSVTAAGRLLNDVAKKNGMTPAQAADAALSPRNPLGLDAGQIAVIKSHVDDAKSDSEVTAKRKNMLLSATACMATIALLRENISGYTREAMDDPEAESALERLRNRITESMSTYMNSANPGHVMDDPLPMLEEATAGMFTKNATLRVDENEKDERKPGQK